MVYVEASLFNNLWVLLSGAFIFIMTISVGLLEIGELGVEHKRSIIKTIFIVCLAFVVMGIIGFNIAFAPCFYGLIGNPFYSDAFLGGFTEAGHTLLSGVWWSMGPDYFNTYVTLPTYFFFETAFASVTLALVGVVALRKMKMSAFLLFSIVYFIIIWTLPAAWIWNPTGWLFIMGMRDFAGGLVVHGAAGAAGLALVLQIWREEKTRGYRKSPKVPINVQPGWITIAILLLWLGWFGFNPGSTLIFGYEASVVVLTTFIAASSALLSMMLVKYIMTREEPKLIDAVNGILMGLIVITPLAGFVSPASAFVLGLIAGPLFVFASRQFSKVTWFSDPVGLFPGHAAGGIFGVIMIAFFTQTAFAADSGGGNLPDGLFFGGGYDAVRQLGIELLGIITVMITVFVISYITIWLIAKGSGGICTDYQKAGISMPEEVA